jgi:hypothetical protein
VIAVGDHAVPEVSGDLVAQGEEMQRLSLDRPAGLRDSPSTYEEGENVRLEAAQRYLGVGLKSRCSE